MIRARHTPRGRLAPRSGRADLAVRLARAEAELQELREQLALEREDHEANQQAVTVGLRELELSRERFANLYDTAPIGFLSLDRNGFIREANLATARLFGVAREKLIDTLLSRFVVKEDRRKLLHYLTQCRRSASQARAATELRVARADGRRLEVAVTTRVERTDRKPPTEIRFHSVLQDITERKQAESRLQASEELFRVMFTNTTVGKVQTDPATGRFLRANPGFCQLVGYTENELLQRTSLEITHPDDREQAAAILRGLKGGASESPASEKRYLRSDGSVVWGYETVNLVCDPEGQPQFALAVVQDITARKQAEEALRRSRDQRELLSSTVSGLLAASDPQTVIERLCRDVMVFLDCDVFFNYLLDPGSSHLRFNACGGVAPRLARQVEGLELSESICGSVARDGRRIVAERIPATADPRTVLLNKMGVRAYACHPLLGANQEVLGTLSFGTRRRDGFPNEQLALMKEVADHVALAMYRKRAEEELRASESRYRTLFETMTEGFALLETIRDASGKACDLKYLAANPAFERQTGRRTEEVVGQKLSTVFPGAEALWLERYSRVEATGEPVQFEAWFSPLQRWFEVRAFRVKPGRIGVVFQDVTARRKAEQERFELHQRLEALMGAVPVGVSFSADASCRQVTGNAAFLAQFEARPEDNLSASAPKASATGRQVRFFVKGRPIQGSELPLQRAVAQNRPTARMEFEVLLPSGRRWACEGWGSPIRDPDGKVIGGVAVTVDITQRKLFEAELERLVRERTGELQETTDQLNAFVYTLAHDLRAPLRAQAAFAVLLLEDFGSALGEVGRNYARRIADSAERQGVLLAGLLKHISLTRSELPLERVDLPEVLRQAQTDLALDVQRADAVVTVGRMEGAVKANAASLHLILTNLLSNAIKFVATGVRPEVKVWTEQRDGWVVLSVADNGLGIPPTHTHKLFGLFQRLHSGSQYPGTGIGLALVKKAAERMGGQVGVESEPGKGSRFWVELQSA